MGSNGQSDGGVSEEFRDYESDESAGQVTSVERYYARNEYGDDEGMSLSCDRA